MIEDKMTERNVGRVVPSEDAVVLHLCQLIGKAQRALARNQASDHAAHPGGEDAAGAEQARLAHQVQVLRRIRQEFEDLVSGVEVGPRDLPPPSEDLRREAHAAAVVELSLEARRALVVLARAYRHNENDPDSSMPTLEDLQKALALADQAGAGS